MKKKIFAAFIAAMMLVSSCAYGFSDVQTGDWFYENVTDMTDNGYLSGYEDGSFRPSGIITKAELVSIVGRISGLNPISGNKSHWAQPMLDAAFGSGFYDWDEIPPTGELNDEPIPRQLAVKIVMKAFLPDAKGEYNDAAKAPDFSDLDGRYYDAVFAAISNGILYGDTDGKLNPKSSLTRAEACAIIMRAANKKGGLSPYTNPTPSPEPLPVVGRKGGVSENGKLSVKGTHLVNESGESVVLHGMSTHGLHWFPQFASEQAIKATADYGANLIRLSMYTDEGGYLTDRSIKNTLINSVAAATKQDMYVIIDWHILFDNDPLAHVDEAVEFFSEMSAKYADNPAVIYEICNEPNGNITWSGNVKPYAEQVINAIRQNSDGVILVGTTSWSQDLHIAAKDPIAADNIMYTCHFYAGTHTDWLRQRIADCGLPVFISEWGTSEADGGGGSYLNESQKWIDFMNARGLSWANWSLCTEGDGSAALVKGVNLSDGISYDELTEGGKFVFKNF